MVRKMWGEVFVFSLLLNILFYFKYLASSRYHAIIEQAHYPERSHYPDFGNRVASVIVHLGPFRTAGAESLHEGNIIVCRIFQVADCFCVALYPVNVDFLLKCEKFWSYNEINNKLYDE